MALSLPRRVRLGESRLSVDVISGERVRSQTRFEAYVFHHNRKNDHPVRP